MRSSQAGFSIIEVLITSALMITLTLAITTLATQQSQSNAFLEDQVVRMNLVKEVSSLMADSGSCLQTVQNIAVGAVGSVRQLQAVKDNLGNAVYTSGTTFEKLNIGNMRLTNKSVSGPNSWGRMEISVPINRQRQGGGPSTLTTYKQIFFVSTNAGGVITSCQNTTGGIPVTTACLGTGPGSSSCVLGPKSTYGSCYVSAIANPNNVPFECRVTIDGSNWQTTTKGLNVECTSTCEP